MLKCPCFHVYLGGKSENSKILLEKSKPHIDTWEFSSPPYKYLEGVLNPFSENLLRPLKVKLEFLALPLEILQIHKNILEISTPPMIFWQAYVWTFWI